MRTRTSWREKMEKPAEPRIVDVPPGMRKTSGPGSMLIATPKLIDALVRQIPSGRLATVAQIMARLAKDHKCDSTCPMTTGIFLRIVAEVAEEDSGAGRKQVTPYWRVIKTDGSLNDKFPGGTARHAGQLRAEGHRIDTTRKMPRVAGFEARLVAL